MKLINLETAKLAKEKSFSELCDFAISQDKEINNGYDYIGRQFSQEEIDAAKDNIEKDHYLCPYQYQLMNWLRDKYKYHIDMYYDFYQINWSFQISNLSEHYTSKKRIIRPTNFISKGFKTYEEALEQGLIYALNLI